MYYIEPITMEKAEPLLQRCGLQAPAQVDWTAGVFDDNGRLVATGSLKEDMIQGVAVEPTRQGEDLLARVLTELIGEAGRRGKSSLYLFTKPEAAIQFQGLGLRTVAVVRPYVALMEWGEAGIDSYVAKLKTIRRQAEKGSCSLTCAAIVMNANPFTKGHRYLVEQAAAGADLVYVLVVEENKSMFSFQDRLEMVRRGTADLPNVTVIGGGRYAVSALTFPSYFTGEEKVAYAQTAMDAELFAKYIGPALGVSLRFVGSEPLSHVTEIYNQALLSRLPKAGIEVRRLQRLEDGGVPISASRVRKILQKAGFQPDHTDLRRLLPETTLSYINEMNLRGIKPWEKG